MKTIRLAYADLQNAGDLFNVDCVERYSGCKVVRSKTFNADMTAIGGALVGAQYSPNLKYRVAQILFHVIYGKKPLYVWGSGFIRSNVELPFYRSNLKVCALRGQKSKEKLEKITGRKFDVPLADAGLLIDKFIDIPKEKKYTVGIIPHFQQMEEKEFIELQNSLPGSKIIDIRKSPQEVGVEIASCEYIISSSLHGLVFADSLHIPALHVAGKHELSGGLFKFEDYYSSYGLKDNVWHLKNGLPTINDIVENCNMNYQLVDTKKEQLIKACPKF